MSELGTGNHATANLSNFMGVTEPRHLPILSTNDGRTSDHLPTGQMTVVSQVVGYTDIPPERQGVDFGQTDYFKYIINDTECLENCTLCVKLDGLTGNGACYPDDVLCQAIEKITFQYGKDLQVLEGDEIHLRRVQETPEVELARLSRLQGMGLTRDERVNNAMGPKWYYLEIPFWWCTKPENSWHQYALQRLTRVVIQWRSAGGILQSLDGVQPTPASGGNYILDHFLRFRVCCLTESTKQEFLNRVKGQGDAGWLYLIGEPERLTQTIAAGQKTFVIQLNTFTKFDYNLRFVVRPVSELNYNCGNNDRWKLKDIESVCLDIGGKRYFFETDRHWMKFALNDKMFEGSTELPIYNIPLGTVQPQVHDHAMGGFDLSNCSTPQMIVNFSKPLEENHVIDFYCYGHNYIRLVIKGAESGAELVQPL